MAKGINNLAGKVIKEVGEEVGKKSSRVNANDVIAGVVKNLGEDFDMSATGTNQALRKFFKETGDFELKRNGSKRTGFVGESLEDVVSSRTERLRKVIDDNNILDSEGLTNYIGNMKPEGQPTPMREPSIKSRAKSGPQSTGGMKMPEGDQVYEAASGGATSRTPKGSATGAKPKEPEYIAPGRRELASKRYDSKKAYMQNKRSIEHENILRDFNAGKFDSDLLKQYDITKDTSKAKVEAMRNQMIGQAKSDDMGFTDMMGYNKIPEKATGTIGTFWLVNKLASDNGEQTNAQLYNQAPY